ncbi:hypothetical protein [Kitasatospora sp. NPDC007106]|uniref:hypothetical protein n=1 Tax=unclassified Kitasatospora TaxID=2633591 RepID=UPI0033D5E82D
MFKKFRENREHDSALIREWVNTPGSGPYETQTADESRQSRPASGEMKSLLWRVAIASEERSDRKNAKKN